MGAQPVWLVVARREFLERVRTVWFLVVTLLGPVGMTALVVVPAWLGARAAKEEVKIQVIDRTADQLGAGIAAQIHAANDRLELELVPPATEERELLARIAADQIVGYLVLPPDLIAGGLVVYKGANATNFAVMNHLEEGIRSAVIELRARRAGLSDEQLATLRQPVPFASIHTTGTATGASGGASFLVGYITMFILYMAILLYAVNVMRSVVLEKTSRVVEVLVSAIKPRALLIGKIFGVGTVGLLQIAAWVAMAWLLATYRAQVLGVFGISGAGGFQLPAIGADAVGIVLAYFLLGYFFYASLYAAIGAMVNSDQEAQQAQTPVVLLLIIPVVCVNLVANDPRSGTAAVLTMIPFASPVLMPMRYLLGGATPVDVALSLGVLLASMVLAVLMAARIYRVGILMYGKRPSLREVARWVRHP